MLRRLKNKATYLIFFGVFFFASFALYHSYRAYLIKHYISLNKKLFDLEKVRINNLRFEMIAIPENTGPSGNTEKYFLRDNINKDTWIFKPHPVHFFTVTGEGISRFLRLCGVDTPELTTISLPINNKNYFGSLQRYIPAAQYPKSGKDFDVSDKRQLQCLLNAEVFAYLFNIRPDFIISAGGMPYAVDLDDIGIADLASLYGIGDLCLACLDSRCTFVMEKLKQHKIMHAVSSENYEGFSKRYLTPFIRGAALHSGETEKLINFITEISDDDFLSFFSIEAFGKSKIYKSYLESVNDRRKDLKERFKQNTLRNKRYTLSELRNKINAIKERIRDLEWESACAGGNKTKQPMLEAVSCPEARFILNLYLFGEVDISYHDTAQALAELQDESASIHEREAVEYYINLLDRNRENPAVSNDGFRYKVINNEVTAPSTGGEEQDEIRNLVFSLNDEQFLLGGSSEKIILKDNNNSLWMFKIAFEYYNPYTYFGVPCMQTDSFLSLFYNAYGLNRMAGHPIILSINNQRRHGNLIKLLPDCDTVEKAGLDNLSLSQRQFIQKVFILDWLLAIAGVDAGDFIFKRDTGEMFTLDKEHAFRDQALPSYKINADVESFLRNPVYGKFYQKFFEDIAVNKKEVDTAELFEFIDSIQSIDDELFSGLFMPYLTEAMTLKFNKFDWLFTKIVNEAQFEYVILQFGSKRYLVHVKKNRFLRKVTGDEVSNYLKQLLDRKHALKKSFASFYNTLIRQYGIPAVSRARGDTEVNEDINARVSSLKSGRMIDFIDLSDRIDLKVIASEKAWFLLKQHPPVSLPRTGLIKELRSIKEAGRNELAAVELYIKRLTEQGFPKHRIIAAPEKEK